MRSQLPVLVALSLALTVPLSGCASLREAFAIPPLMADTPVDTPGGGAPVAVATADLPGPPSPQARTVDEFDTTTAEQRAAAVAAPAPSIESRLGTTIVTLGPPADPGIWVQTPLVSAVAMGRVEDPATGRSVGVELRPSGGSAGSGSQISLAAMRLLELPLTALAELIVYRAP